MRVSARIAETRDLDLLEQLYAELEAELTSLKPIWSATDGLAAPVKTSFAKAMAGPDSGVIIGQLDDVPVGFLLWNRRDLLPQGGSQRLGAIDLIFTEEPARRVGVGEAMIDAFFEACGDEIRIFDAVAPPGHRHAKNFFESHGFKARRIVMHRDDR